MLLDVRADRASLPRPPRGVTARRRRRGAPRTEIWLCWRASWR